MSLSTSFRKNRDRRLAALVLIIFIQAICAAFFAWDLLEDAIQDGALDGLHMVLETLATGALLGGVIVLSVEVRRVFDRMASMQAGIDLASGQIREVLQDFFDEWRLTPAERDVALLILKGLDNENIARIRGTASGTVRAQATSIYQKSGAESRAQFVSLFMEELLAGDSVGAKQQTGMAPGADAQTDREVTAR